MTALPPIHLCIVQPLGYVHSLGLVDPARYFRYQFRRFGADVSIAKNRLRHDAVNFVFGAHLGFDAEQCRRHVCIVVNLEQLGNGGARVAPAYLDLLRRGAVVDYDAANVATYAQNPDDVPLVSFLHAPYLDDGQALPLEQRPIDLLFFGSMNERRRAFIAQVEAAGVQVSCFDHPLYGAERDHFIRQAKAVLNCHFYASSRFEQARAFSCLSLGTPVISERSAATQPPPGFDDVVFWLEEGAVAPFFTGTFGQPSFFDAARRKLEAFRGHDAVERYADLLAFAAGYFGAMSSRLDTAPWQPRRLAVGFDDYRAGWLNIAVTDSAEADVRFDPAHPLDLPARLGLGDGGVAELHAGRVAQVAVEGRSVGTDDARAALLHHALAWLEPAGTLAVERAEDVAWRQLVTEHWRYGDGEHRFAVAEGAAAAGPVLALTKTALTLRERTIARMHRADFGGLPDD